MSRHQEWPSPLGEPAYHGVVGDYVRVVEPHTEGDPAAVLIQTLVCLGNAMGRNPHFYVEDTRHSTNLFAAVVGDTSSSRKGTSLQRAMRLARDVDPLWAQRNDGEGGLSTAEGLIYAVRDPSSNGAERDHGVSDKRLLASMGEFAETLARMKRVENPLSATMRNAWDGKTLRIRTRKQPVESTDAHVSVIGHITRADLSELLTSAEIFNGFGNRFLWVMAKRSKVLPYGGNLPASEVTPIVKSASAAVYWAEEKARRIEFDAKARTAWPAMYEELGRGGEGRFAAITDRAEAQVRRLALIYAVLDCSVKVKLPHLRAAVEVWRYCEDSAAFLFAGEPAHGRLETRILDALGRRRAWTARNHIAQKVFKGEVKKYQLDSAFERLITEGAIEARRVPTRGRPRVEYRVVGGG